MDRPFDRLTRTLGSGDASRRGALRIAGVAALTVALGWLDFHPAAACGKRGRACGKGKRCCAGFVCKSGKCRHAPAPKIATGAACDPAKPDQCPSAVCGCHAGVCTCRKATCASAPCGTDLDCCDGYCHIANICQVP